MRRPEIVQPLEAREDLPHRAFVEGERGQVRQRRRDQRAQAAGQHAGRRAFHRHAAPPHAHEEQREITRRRDREGLADHEVDFQHLDEAAERDGHASDQDRRDLEGLESFLRRGLRPQHAAIDVVREGARHRNEQAAEGAHEGGKGAGTRDAAEDRADDAQLLRQQGRQFQHDLVRALGPDARVEFGHQVAADDAEDRRKHVEHSDQNHHPHRRALRGDAVGIRVEAHEDVRQACCSANQRDDERVSIEQGIRLLVLREVGGPLVGREGGGGGVHGLGRERPEGRNPRHILRRLLRQVMAGHFHDGHRRGRFARRLVRPQVRAVETVNRRQHEDRHADREHLDPVLHGLHERDALHAAERDVERDHRADEHDARPVGHAGENVRERDARALHLRHRVEKPDEQHEAHGDLAKERRVEPALGEIRDRVRAEAAQGPGDEQQEKKITARITHRVPQRVVAGGHHHARDAHERGGGKIFAGDGRRVPTNRNRATGHEEVAGGLGGLRRPESHPDGQDDGDERKSHDPRIDGASGGDEEVHGVSA